jgi:hypothetical protein
MWMMAVAACDTTVHQGGEGPPSPDCIEAESHSDFTFIRDQIFKPGCTFSSCHGATPLGKLSLTTSRAYDQLVGVPAVAVDGWTRVVPGRPDESYLMVKLGVASGPLGAKGGTMPLNNPLLCDGKLGAVRRWIEAGAPND